MGNRIEKEAAKKIKRTVPAFEISPKKTLMFILSKKKIIRQHTTAGIMSLK
jgi:hypothetical protein